MFAHLLNKNQKVKIRKLDRHIDFKSAFNSVQKNELMMELKFLEIE